jgi:hypothetical protein
LQTLFGKAWYGEEHELQSTGTWQIQNWGWNSPEDQFRWENFPGVFPVMKLKRGKHIVYLKPVLWATVVGKTMFCHSDTLVGANCYQHFIQINFVTHSNKMIKNPHENQEISIRTIVKARTMLKHFLQVKERLPDNDFHNQEEGTTQKGRSKSKKQ